MWNRDLFQRCIKCNVTFMCTSSHFRRTKVLRDASHFGFRDVPVVVFVKPREHRRGRQAPFPFNTSTEFVCKLLRIEAESLVLSAYENAQAAK